MSPSPAAAKQGEGVIVYIGVARFVPQSPIETPVDIRPLAGIPAPAQHSYIIVVGQRFTTYAFPHQVTAGGRCGV